MRLLYTKPTDVWPVMPHLRRHSSNSMDQCLLGWPTSTFPPCYPQYHHAHQPLVTPPHCMHDCYIIEDVLKMKLPKWQAWQIQPVCTLLQINMLSEIVDHWGTHLIPDMFYPTPAIHHLQHYNQSSSTLHWPQQHPPAPATWKALRQFIACMYLQPNSMRLQHRIGWWLSMVLEDVSHTYILFHYEDQQWCILAHPEYDTHGLPLPMQPHLWASWYCPH